MVIYIQIIGIISRKKACEKMPEDKNSYFKSMYFDKDLSRVKTDLKSIPLQLYFEISRLASTKKWWEIQNSAGEERF